jgi:phage baseplate assembly protein W
MDRNTGALLAGADHLGQSIGDILSTPIGTRLGRRDYGSLVPQQLDQPNNATGRISPANARSTRLARRQRLRPVPKSRNSNAASRSRCRG